MGRLGLDWIIACLAELCRWDFSKQHLFKQFHKNYKILEITSRSNKGGIFAEILSITMEIFEYHNGAKGGCVCVPEVDNKDS